MENIFQPFPTFIYQNLIEEKVYTFIKKDINNFINNNRSEITTIPGWICNTKSTFSKKDINSKLLNINNLKKSIHFHIENYFKVWSFKQDLDYRIDDIWLNIAKKDEYQEEHNHFDNLFFILNIHRTRNQILIKMFDVCHISHFNIVYLLF